MRGQNKTENLPIHTACSVLVLLALLAKIYKNPASIDSNWNNTRGLQL